ncbi:MAG: hypothetical protein AABX61_03165 [Nanoarchaeota archaeon]
MVADISKESSVSNSHLSYLEDKLLNYKPNKIEETDITSSPFKHPLGIYDENSLYFKWNILPDYVKAARSKLSENDPMYDKIILDKWGRKNETGLYTETPEMVFYRAALKVSEGLTKNNPNLNHDKTVRYIFEKFVNREIFPNTPYMANGGHKLLANYLESRIKESNLGPSAFKINLSSQLAQPILDDLEEEKKQKEQLFACFVLAMGDSRKSINRTLDEASEIQALIGGTGFNFRLRQANEVISGSGGFTDGPVSFMKGYSVYLGTVMNQGGKREGANMFMLDHNHPDIMRFIYSKRQDGEIPAANISIAAWHELMKSYLSSTEEGSYYPLVNVHYNPKKRPHLPKYYSEKQLKKALNIIKMNKKAKLSLLIDKDGSTILSPYGIEVVEDGDKKKAVLTELGLDLNYKPEEREGFVIGKIMDGTVYLNAKKVMKHLATSAWYNGEPGIIFTGTINDSNPTHPKYFVELLKEIKENPENYDKIKYKEVFDVLEKYKGNKLENIIEEILKVDEEYGLYLNLPFGIGIMIATNPCGEKPLLPYEACVLGHVSLESILEKEIGPISNYSISQNKIRENTTLMYEILDNAIDQNYFTLPEIEKTQKSNRKIGLGFMGLANALYKLEISYNSEEALKFVREVWGHMAELSDEASQEKAEKFGEFPNFKYSVHRKGKPLRNAIRRTLAPTGTTGFAAKTTGGCEPEYALVYTRTTVQGTQIQLNNSILEEKLQKYNFFYEKNDKEGLWDYITNVGRGSLQGFKIKKHEGETEESFNKRLENLNKIKKIFVTTYDIAPEDHLRMQAEVQKFTDDAISKTTNFRDITTVEDIEKAYAFAYKLGLKGTTFYRDGTRHGQPIEVKGNQKKSLENHLNEELTNGRLEEIIRKKISAERPEVIGTTKKVKTANGAIFVTLNRRADDNKPYETFFEHTKNGGVLKSYTEALGRVTSVALQAGVPADLIAEQMEGITDTPSWDNGVKINSGPDGISQMIKKVFVDGFDKDKKQKLIKKTKGEPCNLTKECKGYLIPSESCTKCDTCGQSVC